MASRAVFSFEEERLRHPSNLSQCCLKVAKITHDHDTPLAKGTLWLGWMKWFKIRNPNSTLRVVQGLEQCMMKGLCLENVTSLHDNLCDMYYRHNYRNTHISNCDEFGTQAGWNGGGYILAKKGIQSVHIVTPMRENGCVSCLASMHHVLAFQVYIYKGRSFRRNFIITCEEGFVWPCKKKA